MRGGGGGREGGREGGIASERQNMAGPCVRGSEPPSARPTAPEALGRSGTLWDLRHSFCAAAASRPHDGVSHRCINARAGLLAHPAGHASPPAAPADDPILQAKRACPCPADRRLGLWRSAGSASRFDRPSRNAGSGQPRVGQCRRSGGCGWDPDPLAAAAAEAAAGLWPRCAEVGLGPRSGPGGLNNGGAVPGRSLSRPPSISAT